MTSNRYNPTTARKAARKGNAGMTPEQRTARAKKAVATRWAKAKPGWTPPDEDVSLSPFLATVDERWPALPAQARTAAAQALRTAYGRGEL